MYTNLKHLVKTFHLKICTMNMAFSHSSCSIRKILYQCNEVFLSLLKKMLLFKHLQPIQWCNNILYNFNLYFKLSELECSLIVIFILKSNNCEAVERKKHVTKIQWSGYDIYLVSHHVCTYIRWVDEQKYCKKMHEQNRKTHHSLKII